MLIQTLCCLCSRKSHHWWVVLVAGLLVWIETGGGTLLWLESYSLSASSENTVTSSLEMRDKGLSFQAEVLLGPSSPECQEAGNTRSWGESQIGTHLWRETQLKVGCGWTRPTFIGLCFKSLVGRIKIVLWRPGLAWEFPWSWSGFFVLEHLFAHTLNSLLLFLDNFYWASEFLRELFRIWLVFPSSDFLFQEIHFSSLPLSLERAHLMGVNNMAICSSTTPDHLMLSHQHSVKVSFMSVSYAIPPSVCKYVLGMWFLQKTSHSWLEQGTVGREEDM